MIENEIVIPELWDEYDGDSEEELGDGLDDGFQEADARICYHPLFQKEKPRHQWFALNEITNRQRGYSSRLQGPSLFQRRCYGSLHSVSRLKLTHRLEGHAGCVNSLNFNPDGTLLASGSDDRSIIVWDWNRKKIALRYNSGHRGHVFQSKFLPLSGELQIVSSAQDGQVRLAQLNSTEAVRNSRILANHKGPCHKLIVFPEEPHIILSAGKDGVVFNNDVRGPKSTTLVNVTEKGIKVPLYSIHGHPLNLHEFCVSGADSLIRIYDRRNSTEPAASFTPYVQTESRPSRRYHATCAVYNHNGSEILASYNDNVIYLFDTENPEPGKFKHRYQGHRNLQGHQNVATIRDVVFFGPQSEFIVSGSDCGYIYFWERTTESLVQWRCADTKRMVNCLEPHPGMPSICTGGLDHAVKVWQLKSRKEPQMRGLIDVVQKNLARLDIDPPTAGEPSSFLAWLSDQRQ